MTRPHTFGLPEPHGLPGLFFPTSGTDIADLQKGGIAQAVAEVIEDLVGGIGIEVAIADEYILIIIFDLTVSALAGVAADGIERGVGPGGSPSASFSSSDGNIPLDPFNASTGEEY